MPVLVANVLIIALALSDGAHYFLDVLSGLVVALIVIAITGQILNRSRIGAAEVSWSRRLAVRPARPRIGGCIVAKNIRSVVDNLSEVKPF